ncbi:hypothetical protein EVA_10660 [gut metagenome]|uniref:Uncharacterized protein n=1 Tax=gut metagenome TaxID=749906 RepID=J9GMZ4_9ZZZZ
MLSSLNHLSQQAFCDTRLPQKFRDLFFLYFSKLFLSTFCWFYSLKVGLKQHC